MNNAWTEFYKWMKWKPNSNPRGKEEYTLDGKIPIKHQKESWLKYIGVAWMVENLKSPFLWFAIGISLILYIEGF